MPRKRVTVDPNILEKPKLEKEKALRNLKTLVADVFTNAQKPEAVHRVDAISLRDIQLACCLNSPRMIGQPEDIDFEGETRFLKLVFKMIDVVIRAKRKEPAADRAQRFISAFVQYIQLKDEEAIQKAREKKEAEINDSREPEQASNEGEEMKDQEMKDVDTHGDKAEITDTEEDAANEESDQSEHDEQQSNESRGASEEQEASSQTADIEESVEDYETISSRFVESFLRHLLQGFTDSKISVRFRCCQLLALCLSSMGGLDEDLYKDLRTSLLEAYFDKEASVRAQACTALCRLQGDPEIDPVDGQTIIEKLMWSVRHDPSTEVRRLILFNIEVTTEILPFIVKCIKDPDNVNRKVVYLKSLSNVDDFRILDFDQKYQILKWGLNDRNELVQKVAFKMFSDKWIMHADNNLLEFLERLEAKKPVMTPLVEKLLKRFFKDRKDIVNEITFDDEFWSNLTAESALLAKVVIQFLLSNDESDEKIDSILPEVTRHCFNLENYFNLYKVSLEANDKQTTTNYEFIVTQLLDISLSLDYADEVGRRKMFELLRSVLKSHSLASPHLEKVMKIFRVISIDERDFTRSIIEIISDIQEEVVDPFAFENNDLPAKKAKTSSSNRSSPEAADAPETQSTTSVDETPTTDSQETLTQLRCLRVCKLMLENSFEPLKENSNLYGLLNDLIVPAVQNPDVRLREEGLNCLGLCCMLDVRLAQHNITLFITCIQHGHEDLVRIAIRAVSDILLMYGIDSLNDYITSPELVREIFEFGLDNDDAETQLLTAQGLCKLMLFNRYTDKELLRLLVLLYFFPKATTDEFSDSIHQCLAYFFPAYCYSSPEHQKALASISLPALEELCEIYNDLDKDETMVPPKQISDMLADWNDPRKLAMKTTKAPSFIADEEELSYETQGTLAIDTLHIIYNAEEGLKRKTFCYFLFKLYLDKISKGQMAEIRKLIQSINEEKPLKNIPLRKPLLKIADSFDKILGSQSGLSADEENNIPSPTS